MKEMFIKPCPFCGHIPRFTIHDMGYGNGRGYPGNHQIEISCNRSDCCVKPRICFDDIYCETTEAIDYCLTMWNRRKGD